MKEITKLKELIPIGAEGKVCIELTEPSTNKVKERIKGKNHVFTEFLTAGYVYNDSGSSGRGMGIYNWNSPNTAAGGISTNYLCLNDYSGVVDESLPYLKGQTIGYGVPNEAGEGLYKGSYNSENQIISQVLGDKIKWKFQYEFLASQANGVIGCVGLTTQYRSGLKSISGKSIPSLTNYSSDYYYTNDGRYDYYCDNNGIITVRDRWLGGNSSIDISSIVGTISNDNKIIAYAPRTKKYFVLVYSSTAARRKLYRFSSNEFTTLEQVYNIPNITLGNTTSYGRSMYIYGNIIYWMYRHREIRKANYVTDEMLPSIEIVYGHNIIIDVPDFSQYTVADENYIYYYYYAGLMFSPDSETIEVYFRGNRNLNVFNPLIDTKILGGFDGNAPSYSSVFAAHALTAYRLEAPIEKTNANGMTVTYELDVYI